MAVTEPCYATREEVKQALDVKQTTRNDAQVDRAIQAASRSIDALMQRVFYPTIATKYFDWPNPQSTYPWKLYLDASELADTTVNVPVVTSGGNVVAAASVLWGPWNYAPPYTELQLDRSSNASFAQGNTPQRDIHITGIFGYWVRTGPAGVLASALTDTTGTAVVTTNGTAVGVGDHIVVDSERMLVTDKTMTSSTQTQQGSGVSTANVADVSLAVTDGTKFFVGEIVLLDAERMLVVDISGNTLTVKRGWDGSVLATHSGATVYVLRALTVTRGDLGTTAATHLVSAPVSVALVPSLIKELAVAEALNNLLQEAGGYARTQGNGAGAQHNVGMSLDAIRKQAYAQYGRKARTRAV